MNQDLFSKSNFSSYISLTLNFFYSLVDEQGIIQFTKFQDNQLLKDYQSGYAVEDQARALILALKLRDQALIEQLRQWLIESWVEKQGVKVLKKADGKFDNAIDHFTEAATEVIWALGEYLKVESSKFLLKIVEDLVTGLLNKQDSYLRAYAYALLGLSKLIESKAILKSNHHLFTNALFELSNRLVRAYKIVAKEKWYWFEPQLTYANALLPWSLIRVNQHINSHEIEVVAQQSLKFLLENLQKDGYPVVVGNRGWWYQGREMALFDQQPVDVAYMVLCCIEGSEKLNFRSLFSDKAHFYYSWFFGNNLKKSVMIRKEGGCYDGLTPTGPNLNSGAESNICFLLASYQILK